MSSAKRSPTSSPRGASAALDSGSPCDDWTSDVAALERALGVVAGQREREPLELLRASPAAVEQRGVGLALEHQRALAGEAAL